jgi:hypothetical protein
MDIKSSVQKYTGKYTSKPWFWYAIVGVLAAASYPFIVDLLSQQFSVYQLYVGNPATYIFVFVVYGLWFNNFYTKRWGHGKIDLRGNIMLLIGAVTILFLLVYVFGYKFLFLSK